jgi:ClpP class serine protease
VGSIGVWQAHQDLSKALDKAGVATTLISAGKFKTEGHPYGPLPGDAKAFFQSRIDDYYAAFTDAVAKGRKVSVAQVRNGMGQGRVLGAQAALAERMIDGIGTFQQVAGGMLRNVRPGGGRTALAIGPARRSVQAIRNEIDLLSL